MIMVGGCDHLPRNCSLTFHPHSSVPTVTLPLPQECDAHVAGVVRDLAAATSLDPVPFLSRLDAAWRELCAGQMTIRQIFLYLDRSYVITATPLRSLFDLGLQQLRAHMAATPRVRQGVGGGGDEWGGHVKAWVRVVCLGGCCW